jgi:hypothetical protein
MEAEPALKRGRRPYGAAWYSIFDFRSADAT